MRVMEGHFIRDCAEMAARASLFRKESRWGLYHYRSTTRRWTTNGAGSST